MFYFQLSKFSFNVVLIFKIASFAIRLGFFFSVCVDYSLNDAHLNLN